jgi:hypothetical protein
MTIHPHFTFFPSLVRDLEFLVAHSRGPISTKSAITTWTEAIKTGDDQSWQLDKLKSVCEALVIIALANAAFCVLPVQANARYAPHYEIEDQGGYYASLVLVSAILEAAPLCDDCHGELVRSLQHSLATHLHEIERRLPRR